jgi:hypothetical protein
MRELNCYIHAFTNRPGVNRLILLVRNMYVPSPVQMGTKCSLSFVQHVVMSSEHTLLSSATALH